MALCDLHHCPLNEAIPARLRSAVMENKMAVLSRCRSLSLLLSLCEFVRSWRAPRHSPPEKQKDQAGLDEDKQGVGKIMGAKMWQRKVVSLCLFTI